MPALDNATLDTPQAAPLAEPEPTVALNEPEVATLPPPLPDIQSGKTPAVLVPPITKEMLADPLIDSVVNHFDQLSELGIGYYEAADQSTVLFNPEKVTEEQLKEAEQNGTLAQLAPPLGSPAPADQPAAQSAPLAAEQLQAQAPAGEAKLETARIQNVAPRQVSPIQPRPVTGQLARRPL